MVTTSATTASSHQIFSFCRQHMYLDSCLPCLVAGTVSARAQCGRQQDNQCCGTLFRSAVQSSEQARQWSWMSRAAGLAVSGRP